MILHSHFDCIWAEDTLHTHFRHGVVKDYEMLINRLSSLLDSGLRYGRGAKINRLPLFALKIDFSLASISWMPKVWLLNTMG